MTLTAPHAPPEPVRHAGDLQHEATVIVLRREPVAAVPALDPAGIAATRGSVLVDGYVRASVARSRFASRWQTDRGHIERWAAARGWRVRGVFEESCSGGLAEDSSLLREALVRIESWETDGLVVARLTHLGESLADVIGVLERIHAAGGRFVSVCDGLDLGTTLGRLTLPLLLSLLEW
jgi:hypothetical protein